MGTTRRIRTVLYDDQEIEATELDLLHSPALQRLYDLHQLGLADRVFIDASHSRLHHVVGVIHQVEKLVAAIERNLRTNPDLVLIYTGGCEPRLASEWEKYVIARRPAVRLMGFLHDLTHSPFGHTLEDEIRLFPSKHDEPNRQANAFFRLLCQWLFWLVRDSGPDEAVSGTWGSTIRKDAPTDEPKTRLARYLDAPDLLAPPEDDDCIDFMARLAAKHLKQDSPARHTAREPKVGELKQFLHNLYFAMQGLLYLDSSHKKQPKAQDLPNQQDRPYSFEKLIRAILKEAGDALSANDEFRPHRDAFLLDIIGNTICADLLDYAKRDCHFAGLKLNYDADRIVENFTLVSHEDEAVDGPFVGRTIRTAISIFSHKLRIDAPGELLNLLQVRFYLYQRVLYHPTKCIAGAMLGAALQQLGLKTPLVHLAHVGDAIFLHQVSEAARVVRDLLKTHGHGDVILTPELAGKLCDLLDLIPVTGVLLTAKQILADRTNDKISEIEENLRASIRLFDRLFSRRYYRPVFRLLPSNNQYDIDGKTIAEKIRHPIDRFRIEREIERRASLPAGTVVIHCPDGAGPQKIAAMLVTKGPSSQSHKLRDIAKLNPELFQKHQQAINALEEMYQSMWRLVVAVAPPLRAKYRSINEHIASVLHEEITEKVLGHRQIGKWNNDRLMEQELELAVGTNGTGADPDQVIFSSPPPPTNTIEPRRRKANHREPTSGPDLYSPPTNHTGVPGWSIDLFALPTDELFSQLQRKAAHKAAFEASRSSLLDALPEFGSGADDTKMAKAQKVWTRLCKQRMRELAARTGKSKFSPITKDEWLKLLRRKEGLE